MKTKGREFEKHIRHSRLLHSFTLPPSLMQNIQDSLNVTKVRYNVVLCGIITQI